MEINTTLLGLTAELRIQGRVDTFWADHLQGAVDYVVDQGARNLRLHMGGVDYLSSAGIRVLIVAAKKIQAAKGRLEIVQPSASAMSILDMAGLTDLVSSTVTEEAAMTEEVREIPTAHAIFHEHSLGAAAPLQCSMVGSTAGVRSGLFRGNDTRNLMYPDSTFGLGLGAFGNNYEDCRGRHGEYIALAGAAAYQPTDGTDVPEYMVSEGDWVPELNVLYGLWAQGRFSRYLEFDATPAPGVVPFSEILQTALSSAQSDTIGFVMLAESNGLLGVGLKRSISGLRNLETPLSFRDVRKALSGDPTRHSQRVLSVVVGVASLNPPDELSALFHPVVHGSHITAHANAGIFPRHSIDEGVMDLRRKVQALFQSESLSDLIHLMADESNLGLEGETHFIRGACWAGAIDSIGMEQG